MLKVFAPAKINLHLHVTGKRADGYHLLDSLVCFADIGDYLVFEPANGFHFHVTGDFASALTGNDLDSSASSSNTVVRAARLLGQSLNRDLSLCVTLHKNIPSGAGMGGGSADAAACLRGLCEFWDVSVSEDFLAALALQIGSDVPVCLKSSPVIMRGIGEEIYPAPKLPEIFALLIWPNISVPTQTVFKKLSMENYSSAVDFPITFSDAKNLVSILRNTSNDLAKTAIDLYPVIGQALSEMEAMEGCYFSRMSGSGSSLFGFFETEERAIMAVEKIKKAHPDWWVRPCRFNKS